MATVTRPVLSPLERSILAVEAECRSELGNLMGRRVAERLGQPFEVVRKTISNLQRKGFLYDNWQATKAGDGPRPDDPTEDEIMARAAAEREKALAATRDAGDRAAWFDTHDLPERAPRVYRLRTMNKRH